MRLILRSLREQPPGEGVKASRPEPVGAILAGGLGRRIGGAKATVQLCGRPLIAYPLRAMSLVLDEVMVVAKADTELPDLIGVTVWMERDPVHHPLIGILEALAGAGGRPVLVCAADLPFVTPELISTLIANRGHSDAVLAASSGDPQPLLGLYEPSAASSLARALAGGLHRTREAVGTLSPSLVEVGDPDLLFNVNAPEDLLRASAMISRR